MTSNISLAPLLQSFFTDRLIKQKQVSPHTISSYRDTFRLLLQFLAKQLRKTPSQVLLKILRLP
jgi:integrase/recombinase XerD